MVDWFHVKEIAITEGLDDYSHTLHQDDLDWSVKELNYYSEEYNLTMMDKFN